MWNVAGAEGVRHHSSVIPAMKRASSTQEASAPEARKRKVAYATFKKWKAEMDRECQTLTWLDCDMEIQSSKRFVTKLQCNISTKFKMGILSR